MAVLSVSGVVGDEENAERIDRRQNCLQEIDFKLLLSG